LESDRQRLAQLHEQMAPLQAEINQLNRQFWVTKAQVKANKYDLSASRYRQIEQDEPFYESPRVTMERLLKLEFALQLVNSILVLKDLNRLFFHSHPSPSKKNLPKSSKNLNAFAPNNGQYDHAWLNK
jgi:hypothetical protein